MEKTRFFKSLCVMLPLSMAMLFLMPSEAFAAYDGKNYNQRFSNKYQIIRPTGYDTNITASAGGGNTVVYINGTNGATYSESLTYEIARNVIPKKIRIPVGEYTDLKLFFVNGVVKVDDPEAEDDEIVDVRDLASKVNLNPYDKTIYSGYDVDAYGNENYYYYNESGEKVYVGFYSNLPSASTCEYIMRLNALKAGKTTITFTTTTDEGRVLPYEIKVTAVDTTPFKYITYAGKSLWYDSEIGASNNNYIYSKKRPFSQKKSGKLKIKMNKNYSLKKIEVGTLYEEAAAAPWGGNPADYNKSYTDDEGTVITTSYNGVSQRHAVDLNGDGDTLDTIGGISESSVIFKMRRVSNNKSFKLSKVGPLDDYQSGTFLTHKKYSDGTVTESTVESTSQEANLAPTLLRVTFYDKIEKQNYTFETILYRRINK
ncbi:hypothetical protein [Butyrivibrio sp. VCD2006]|uniref:hypothetical protein n=1 Tax=Butyrivibrio sp. VCD2006 TaxID=1280664 RepID=UPI00040287BA|nr:hypothetical protein [Butyrivibrio sp. VCD2006]